MTRPTIPFERRVEQQLRRGRPRSPESGPALGGYGAIDDSIRALIGNDVGPYQNIIGRASEDGVTGLVEVQNGESQIVATDLFGRLWTRSDPVPPVTELVQARHTEVEATSLVVSSTPAILYQMRGIVAAGVELDLWIQAFNAAVLPADGTEPKWEMLVPATETAVESGDDFGATGEGLPFSNGIVLAVSDTSGVLTVSDVPAILFATYKLFT